MLILVQKSPILDMTRIFLKKRALSLFCDYGAITSCKKSEKSNGPILRQRFYRRKDKRTDGRTDGRTEINSLDPPVESGVQEYLEAFQAKRLPQTVLFIKGLPVCSSSCGEPFLKAPITTQRLHKKLRSSSQSLNSTKLIRWFFQLFENFSITT